MAVARRTHLKTYVDTRFPQLGDTFLSSKHLDYLAVIAEFWSAVRA